MHLKQPGFTYSTCGPFTKKEERITKLNETGDTKVYLQKYEGYQRGLASMVYKAFNKKTTGTGIRFIPQN